MIKLLKNIFSAKPKVNYKEVIASGGQIVDVRTKEEYASGHIKGSINIPLNSIGMQHSKLKKKNR